MIPRRAAAAEIKVESDTATIVANANAQLVTPSLIASMRIVPARFLAQSSSLHPHRLNPMVN